MKKTLAIIALASASTAFAASLSYDELPAALKAASTALVYANSFNDTTTATINSMNAPTGIGAGSTNTTGVVGSSVDSQPYSSISLGNSFTLSLDLVAFEGANWSDVVSICASANLSIEKDASGIMHVYVNQGFAGSTNEEGGDIVLGEVDKLTGGTTLTVVMNAADNTVTAYINEKAFDNNSVTLTFAEETEAAAPTGMQLGSGYNGGHGATTVEMDNLYIWNTALTADQVALIPEPATATLSLLALAGLCARRRRA